MRYVSDPARRVRQNVAGETLRRRVRPSDGRQADAGGYKAAARPCSPQTWMSSQPARASMCHSGTRTTPGHSRISTR